MLIITSQLRSIKDGRSHRILPEWVEAYFLRFGSDPSRRPDASCARRVHAVCKGVPHVSVATRRSHRKEILGTGPRNTAKSAQHSRSSSCRDL
jgi:hypothetical protein